MKETDASFPPPPPREKPLFDAETPGVHADAGHSPRASEGLDPHTLLEVVKDLTATIRAMNGSGDGPGSNFVYANSDGTLPPGHDWIIDRHAPPRRNGWRTLATVVAMAGVTYLGSSFFQKSGGETTPQEIKGLFGNSAGALFGPAVPRPLDGIEAFTTTNTLAAPTKWDFSGKDSSKYPFTGVAEKLNSNMLTTQADVRIKWAVRAPYDAKDKTKSALTLENKKSQLTQPLIDLGKVSLKPLVDISALTKGQDGQNVNMPPFFRFAIEKKTDKPEEAADIAASKAAAEKLVPLLEQSGVLPKPDGINKSGTDLMGEVYRANQMDLVHQIVAAIIGDTVLVDKEAVTQQVKNRLVRLYGLDNPAKYKPSEFTGTAAFQNSLSRLAEEYLAGNHVTAKYTRIVTNEKMPGQEMKATRRTAIDDGPYNQRAMTWVLPQSTTTKGGN